MQNVATQSRFRLAREYDIDVSTLKGNGPRSRIVRGDVERAKEDQKAATPSPFR
ncbi:E3 binding domain-containing protein [Mesorhizobium sp. M0830]|uniref:E3 binding domain-containing protein n=1 Tax=Mesorhizobium sp. M0830 TaxID=2957008 RepID=UPI003339D9BB